MQNGTDRISARPQASVVIAATNITSDAAGFSKLARLHNDLSIYSGTDIGIDFSRVKWIDGHLAAPLNVVIRHAEAKRNTIKCTGFNNQLANIFTTNGFLKTKLDDKHRRTMPITEYRLDQQIDFSFYAKRHLDRPEMPKMTDALQGKFFEGVDELFANSALHSESKLGVTVCGQFYSETNLLDFVIADGGRTIPGSLRAFQIAYASDDEAIDWAMAPFNTTRQGDIPGGLGSKVLRDFVSRNKGRLLVASRAGFWCQTSTYRIKSRLPYAYPGTAVILEIKTSDRNKYDLADAPNPRDIW